MEDKKIYRTELRALRDSLDENIRTQFSKKIINEIMPMIKDEKNIGIYMAIQSEVDVTALANLNKKIYAPKITGPTTMDFLLLEDLSKTKPGVWNIPEPTSNIKIDPQDLDVIVVPLLGFDSKLHRLGNGAGYYDRYLKKCGGRKIGVAFEIQKVAELPINTNDVSLDIIISEKGMYMIK